MFEVPRVDERGEWLRWLSPAVRPHPPHWRAATPPASGRGEDFSVLSARF
jgi:hypothetical protein